MFDVLSGRHDRGEQARIPCDVQLDRSAQPVALAAAIRDVLVTDSDRAAARSLGEAVRREANSDALIRELEAI